MTDDDLRDAAEATMHGAVAAGSDTAAREPKKRKKKDRPLEEQKVYEAGAVIVCDGKVVLRLTDKQRWIFPKGKLKKHESPVDAAVREATEETGLKVSVINQVADLLIKHEGKKRRFVFYLMRATAKTWDWPHHEGRDTFLITPERVSSLIRHAGYSSVWQACQEHVKGMCEEPVPFVSRHTAALTE